MASTYSSLKIELIGTGDQAGTWGNTTNTNLGTALEEAITGSANVTFASSNAAIALTDTNAAQTARNLRLNLVGTISSVQTLFVPAIEKQYLITNTLSNSIVISNGTNASPTGTTFTLPAGRSSIVFNDGTNINDVITFVTSLSNVTINGGTANSLSLTNVTISSGAINGVTSNGSTFSNVVINSGTVGNTTINAYTEGVIAVGNTGNAVTLNIANATIVTATLTANCTFTMPGNTSGKSFILLLKTGTGNFTGTFTSVKFASNTAPTITTAANKMDILTFIADGANWYGNYSQGYIP
jgi:hypothetical protein